MATKQNFVERCRRGAVFVEFNLVESRTDHNHEDILEMVDSYGMRWLF